MSRAGEVYENSVAGERVVIQVGIEMELTKYLQGVYSSVDKAGQSMSGIGKWRR